MKLTLEQANRIMAENAGSLDLRDTEITSLPEGLEVGGTLCLNGTKVAELPKGLVVGGPLYLSDTPVTSLPEDLTVGGSLVLDGTGITSLPDGLAVGSWLYLRGTGISSLPDNLAVGGSLVLDGTAASSLPEDLAVGGRLYIDGRDATERIPHRLRDGDHVPGRYFYANGVLTHVEAVKHVDGYTVYVGRIKGRNIITDGKRYARCNKIQDAKDLAARLRDGIKDRYGHEAFAEFFGQP